MHRIWRRLLLWILLLIVSMAFSILNPILIGKFVDLLSNGIENRYLIRFILLLAALWLCSAIISYLSNVNSAHINIRLSYNINFHLLQHVERLPLDKLESMDMAYLNTRIHSDSCVVVSFVQNSLLGALIQMVTCILVFAMILSRSLFIGFLITLLLPVYVIIYACFKNVIEQSSKEMMETRDAFWGEMQNQLRHIRTVKLNSWYDRLYEILIRQFCPVYTTAIKSTKINTLYGLLEQITRIAANLIIFLVCGVAVNAGSMNLGNLITINSLFTILFTSFTSLMDFGRSYANARAAYDRINELESMEEEKNGEQSPDRIKNIQISNLSFRYPGQQENIIDYASLDFSTGKIYQIKGENGCGKSTLLNLLLGLYEADGRICYNGIPINQLNMLMIRQNLISVVEQEPPLVFGTVSENISEEFNDKNELLEKICLFDLASFIGSIDLETNRHLADGMNTLSGGEKQKIAILRALLKKSDILIFDEPVSALDYQSCNWLKETLKELKQNRIIILIEHQSIFSDIIDVTYNLHRGKVTCELF